MERVSGLYWLVGLQITLNQFYHLICYFFRVSPQDRVKMIQGNLTAFPKQNVFCLGNLNIMDIYMVCSRGKEFLGSQPHFSLF